MKSLIAFWNKDVINKLIVLVLFALAAGSVVVGVLILRVSRETPIMEAISGMLPAMPTPTFDIKNYLTPNANITPAPTRTPEPVLAVPTFTPFELVIPTEQPPMELPTTAVGLPSPTVEVPTVAQEPPTSAADASPSLSGEAACIPANPQVIGRVLEVLDGNTVRALLKDTGLVYTVRYIGIEAPKDKNFGDLAKNKNGGLVYGQGREVTFIMDSVNKDDRGRLLRYALINGTFVNAELIRQGLGLAVETPGITSCSQTFKQAEDAAISAASGLWAVPTPKP
jgi:endonuclease YncB( thermonuclease family)